MNVAKDNLKDTSHSVKCRSLQLISELYPIYPESDRTRDMTQEADAIVKLLGDYSNAEVKYCTIFIQLFSNYSFIYEHIRNGSAY